MAPVKSEIRFAHIGIGEVLANHMLRVPPNQREYRWEEEHVKDLFTDFASAIGTQGSHFLGTIVLTSGAGDTPEVADGQQRLATTTILLAAIRDYFHRAGDTVRSNGIGLQYLVKIDIPTGQTVPRLRLNIDDNEFFRRYVLAEPDSPDRQTQPTRESHTRIQKAASMAAEYIDSILSPFRESDRTRQLARWMDFVNDSAEVVVLRVPDNLNAFVMFETLNDRGLRISQADLLKNHLLSCARERMDEAQQKWAQMVGTLETLGEEDLSVTYLHHLLITKYGPTKANEVFDKVDATVGNETTALAFLAELAQGANEYVALFHHEHAKWADYAPSMRHSIATINGDLRVDQIRPLMFAVARHFSPQEAEKAFRLFVFWSVRFLIVGGRGGLLDRNYAITAQRIGDGTIRTSKDLTKAMRQIVPTDAAFEAEFAVARVSLSRLARYYLRAMERQAKGDSEPEFVPSDDKTSITLEHILPQNPEASWPGIDAEAAAAAYKRLGNMVLLKASKNSALGNRPYAGKKAALAASAYLLTSEASRYEAWGPAEIGDRQKRMAKLAVKTWPLSLKG